jgi:hypothetical protein
MIAADEVPVHGSFGAKFGRQLSSRLRGLIDLRTHPTGAFDVPVLTAIDVRVGRGSGLTVGRVPLIEIKVLVFH